MPRGRMLNKKISKDDKVAVLSMEANLLYTWLIPYADLKGRMIAIPGSIKWMVVPLLNYFNEENIKKYLLEIRDKGLINLYGTDNIYLEMIGFSKNQRVDPLKEAPSEIPNPAQLQSYAVAKLNKKLKYKAKDKEHLADQGSANPGKSKKETNPYLKKVIDHICVTWQNRPSNIYKSKYCFTGKHAKLISDLCRLYESHNVMALWDLYLSSDDDFFKTCGYSIEVFGKSMPKLLDKPYKSVSKKYEKELYPGEDQSGNILSKLNIDIKGIK